MRLAGRGRRARAAAEPPPIREVPIREDVIRLGQFLKLADLVDNGSDVRPLVQDGLVAVNGEVETRRGRQLHPGDEVAVTLPGMQTTVRVSAESEDLEQVHDEDQ